MSDSIKGLPIFAPETILKDILDEIFIKEEFRCFSKFRKAMMKQSPLLPTGNKEM